jgi:cellulose synthase/poly-beta-1,6-N-acetylglucosamine synthase-like glycosyltransferase
LNRRDRADGTILRHRQSPSSCRRNRSAVSITPENAKLGTASGVTDPPFNPSGIELSEVIKVSLWIPLGVIGILSWSVWFIRRYISHHRYQEVVNDFRCSTSLVVPVYREDPDVLERCLRTWLAESPGEILLVVDDRDNLLLDRLAELDLASVRVIAWRHTGKRGAMAVGARLAAGDVIVFSDSDTSWRSGLLARLQMPFVDPRVGGVGSRQHVYLPHSDVRRRVAYWLLNTRYLDFVPAMSRWGGVACLSGRTVAYRRSVIIPRMDDLEHEIFLGRECVSGDDGRLTWLVLAAGYRTVHQASAEADSMFPDSWRDFVQQRVRWSRNSYRCYLTAMGNGWLWRQPLITQVTVLQVLLTPVTIGAAVFYLFHWALLGWQFLVIAVVWAVVGRALRGLSHLREHPAELRLAPLMAGVVIFLALFVKLWAAATTNRQGWLTRVDGDRVHGQREIVTTPDVVTTPGHGAAALGTVQPQPTSGLDR